MSIQFNGTCSLLCVPCGTSVKRRDARTFTRMCMRPASASGPEYVLTIPTSLYLLASTTLISTRLRLPVRPSHACACQEVCAPWHFTSAVHAPCECPATLALLVCGQRASNVHKQRASHNTSVVYAHAYAQMPQQAKAWP